MALGTSVAVAHADETSSTLYVNNAASAHCTDTASGAGSAATPFCTVQAAANAAVAGDTVQIASGTYAAATITSTGTAQEPIVFEAVAPGGRVAISPSATGPALTFDGASYVSFEGRWNTDLTNPLYVDGALVTGGSSHITLDSMELGNVEVAGTAGNVTVSRDRLITSAVTVDPGSSNDVISTNWFEHQGNDVSVTGASNVAVTSNTVTNESTAADAISVSGASTGVTVENNILTYPELTAGTGALISVDPTAAAGTTVDYNVVWPTPDDRSAASEAAYSWAGTDYATATALSQATGQGVHDLTADPQISGLPFFASADAPEVNSANSAAPGSLGTDFFGDPCTGNPLVPATGAGSPADCARGAFQGVYSTMADATTAPVGALSADLNLTVTQTVGFGAVENMGGDTERNMTALPAVSYRVNWGDGKSATYAASSTQLGTEVAHTYAKSGVYTITDTAVLADGSTKSTTTTFTTRGSDYSAVPPARILDTRHGTGAPEVKVPVGGSVTVQVAGVDGIPADATAVALNLTVTDTTGDGFLSAGSAATSNLNYTTGTTVANSVIAPVSNGAVTIYNTGLGGSVDVIADVYGYFAPDAADQYATVPLQRILSTRDGIGAAKAKVPAKSGIPVTIAGVDSIPAGVSAVAVHITVADTTGIGWIAAEPDGAGVPGTSSLNYGPGQIVSNTIIVPVASDGRIELYNGGGTTPVDLLADVSGYFSSGAGEAYVPITPERVWDTRQIPGGPVAGGATVGVALEGDNGDAPAGAFPSNATLVSNVTVTDTKSIGFLTVFPQGTTRPSSSNLNWGFGQTLASMAVLSTTGPYQEVSVYNASTGSTDVVFDVFGYFSNS
jgi:hypothetical protein